jgi:hypothetical protein
MCSAGCCGAAGRHDPSATSLGEVDFIKNNIEVAIRGDRRGVRCLPVAIENVASPCCRLFAASARRNSELSTKQVPRKVSETAAAIAGALRLENATAPIKMTNAPPAIR